MPAPALVRMSLSSACLSILACPGWAHAAEGRGAGDAWRGWIPGAAGVLLAWLALEWVVLRGAHRLRAGIRARAAAGRLPVLRVQRAELVTSARTGALLVGALNLALVVAHVVVLYATLLLAFSLFPETRGWGLVLRGWILDPLRTAGRGLIDFLPNLVHITVVVLLAHLGLRALRRVAREVEVGNLRIPGFYADWARPTLNIAVFLAYAFVLVLVFPYLPGSDSPVFKGVSVFLGLLISLGSSSALANVIAGLVITYMRAFKTGDRVRIGDTTGDVVEKTLLVTRLRTVYHETVTVPNSALLGGNTINYTDAAASGAGLLLHVTVTIGYDRPWRQVHVLLKEAAARTTGVLADPAPYVLQSGLDDFYARYELNAAIREAHRMRFIHSELRQNIQDVFFEAGVEIMSPHFRAVRDGSAVAAPPRASEG